MHFSQPLIHIRQSRQQDPRQSHQPLGCDVSHGIYQPLESNRVQIRLLKIQSRKIGGKISCRLETFDLASSPLYTALSYAWQACGTGTEMICLQGKSFTILCNLFDFLRTERKHPRFSSQNYYWIDALCINQKDNMEKNHQVKRMVHIYYTAKEVITWLGREPVSWFMKAAKRVDFGDKQWNRVRDQFIGSVTHGSDSERTSRDRVFKNPYWTRVWIIQEIMWSKGVIVRCGNTEVPLGWLPNLVFVIKSWAAIYYGLRATSDDYMRTNFYRLSSLKLRFTNDNLDINSDFTLWNLISRFHNWESSDPRDKLFALYGVATDASTFPVDYNMTVEHLFGDTVTRVMKLYGGGLAPTPWPITYLLVTRNIAGALGLRLTKKHYLYAEAQDLLVRQYLLEDGVLFDDAMVDEASTSYNEYRGGTKTMKSISAGRG